MRRRLTLAGSLLLASAPQASAAERAYSATPAPYRAHPLFAIAYHGSGTWHTTYHSEPPNPGGMHDRNDAHDSSAQRWHLAFVQPVALRSGSLTTAVGSESATGTIDHTHIDGLFAADNASEQCTVSYSTPPPAQATVTVSVTVRGARFAAISAGDPMSAALGLLSQTCPADTDPIDGLSSNYFTPGFSVAEGWGPDQWFASQTVRVPLRTLHRARRIAIRLHETHAGTPPASCAVLNPSIERCRTGGEWSGVLTLTRRAPGGD
jgi:hypothetical protein